MFPSTACPNHGRFIYHHVKALVEAGLDVRVLQPVPWAPWFLGDKPKWRDYRSTRSESGYKEVEVTRLSYPHPPSGRLTALGSITLMPSLTMTLLQVKRSFDFEIVHAHSVTPDGFAGVIGGRLVGVPVVVSARGSDIHSYPFRNRLTKFTARFAITRCDHLVCVSSALARQAHDLVSSHAATTVIYNGVDTDRFAPLGLKAEFRRQLGLPESNVVLLSVGALASEKGIPELIEAFNVLSINRPGARLVVIGDGPLRAEIEELAVRLGCHERVALPGAVTDKEVAGYMQAADVLVHPSHAEGLPNVVLEAMACGLPVVASNVGGIPEVVVPDETGLLVPPQDAPALVRALEELLADNDLALAMGNAGRQRVMKRHCWKRNAREHLQLYREAIETRQGGRGQWGN